MQRAIVGFERDDVGDWVALLECGHRQHVRHRPPWQERPWVLTSEARQARLGAPLECADCDAGGRSDDEGGDPACWVDKVCAECGAIVEEGASHRTGCPAAPA